MKMLFLILLALCLPLSGQELRVITRSMGSNTTETIITDDDRVILAKPKSTTTAKAIEAIAKTHKLKDKTKFKLLRWKKFEVPLGQSKSATIQKLRESGLFEHVQENRVYIPQDTIPNDTFFSQMWGLTNIEAQKAWDLSREAPTVIAAVVDTGIDFTHPDLAGNLWTGPNGEHGYTAQNDLVVPGGIDDYGHGTHVAGTIGATGNNAMGVTGIAWRTKILSMKVLHSGTGNSTDIANGCEKLVELKQAGYPILVSNHSYGGTGDDPIMEDGFRLLDGADIFAAIAAGNSNVNIDGATFTPAIFEFSNIISTMASDSSNLKASFSCFGIAKTDIAAPGVGILSTTPQNTYSAYSGTSMATPHVCGVALLLRARNPSLSAHAIRDLILDPGSYDSIVALSNNNTSARINLNKAIRNPRLFENPFKLNRWPVITNITPFVVMSNASFATITADVSDPDGDALRFSSILSSAENDRSGYLVGLLKKNGLSVATVANTTVISGNPSAYQLSSDVMMACSDNRGGSGFGASGFEIARNNSLRKPLLISTWMARTNAEFGSFSWTFDVSDPNKNDYSYWITWSFSGGNSVTFYNGTPGPWTNTQPFGRTMTNFNVRVFVMDKWLNYSNSETINFYPPGYIYPKCVVTTSSTEGNVPFDVKFDLAKSTGPITHYLIFDRFGTLESTIGATQSLTFTVPGVTFKDAMAYNVLTGDQDHKIVPVYSSRFAEFGMTNQPPPPPSITNLVVVTNLTAGFSGTTTVLRWTDNSILEDRYMIEASYKTRFYTSPWTTIGTVGPNQDFFVHVPNVRRATWSYRIKACGGQLCAPNSNIASVRVK